MPYLQSSSYKAPLWLPGGHAQTIFPALFRKVAGLPFRRRRIDTPDGDFFEVDLLNAGGRQAREVVILSHGLEGNSRRKYMRGMCIAFVAQGWDCVSRNFRCCGGSMNLGPGMYHSGQTDDLHSVVEDCLDRGYERIMLLGFSMGGNQVLKYLGEEPDGVPHQIVAAAAFSVPCDLPAAARELDKRTNCIYMGYFLRTLRRKVRLKHALYPKLYPLEGLEAIRTFAVFDERYTAPVHGFASARDYWSKAASLPYLARIRIPVLLVNAENDTFLSASCYPRGLAEKSRNFFLEIPEAGGHVGFASSQGEALYWSEARAVEFFNDILL